jgi:hypothetical protein
MKGSLLPLASGGFQSNPTHSFPEINQSKRPVKGPFSAPFAALPVVPPMGEPGTCQEEEEEEEEEEDGGRGPS